MKDKVASMLHTITVRVTDSKTYINGQMQTIVSTTTVKINVEDLAEDAPYNTGSIRLSGRCPLPIVSHSCFLLWFLIFYLVSI